MALTFQQQREKTLFFINEPPLQKTNSLHMGKHGSPHKETNKMHRPKQICRSAVELLPLFLLQG